MTKVVSGNGRFFAIERRIFISQGMFGYLKIEIWLLFVICFLVLVIL